MTKSRLREKVEQEKFFLKNIKEELRGDFCLTTDVLIPMSKVRSTMTFYIIQDNKFDSYILAQETKPSYQYSVSDMETIFRVDDHREETLLYLGEKSTLIFDDMKRSKPREEHFYKFLVTGSNIIYWFSSLGVRLLLESAVEFLRQV